MQTSGFPPLFKFANVQSCSSLVYENLLEIIENVPLNWDFYVFYHKGCDRRINTPKIKPKSVKIHVHVL